MKRFFNDFTDEVTMNIKLGVCQKLRLLSSRKGVIFLAFVITIFCLQLVRISSPIGAEGDILEAEHGVVAWKTLKDPLFPFSEDAFKWGKNEAKFLYPMRYYPIAVSYAIFGYSAFSMRLYSLASLFICLPFLYSLANDIYDKKVAYLSIFIFPLLPIVTFWAGKSQQDIPLTALYIATLACIVRGFKRDERFLTLGAFFFIIAILTKPPALLLALIVVVWYIFQKSPEKKEKFIKLIKWTLIFIIPVVIIALYLIFVKDFGRIIIDFLSYHAVERHPPFDNTKRLIVFGLGTGAGPLALLAALYSLFRRAIKRDNILLYWLLIHGAFTFIFTPYWHDHYILPLIPVIAILAAKGLYLLGGDVEKRFNLKQVKTFFVISLLLITTSAALSYEWTVINEDVGDMTLLRSSVFLKDYEREHANETVLYSCIFGGAGGFEWYAEKYSLKGVFSYNNTDSTHQLSNDTFEWMENNSADNVLVIALWKPEKLESETWRREIQQDVEARYEEIHRETYTNPYPIYFREGEQIISVYLVK